MPRSLPRAPAGADVWVDDRSGTVVAMTKRSLIALSRELLAQAAGSPQGRFARTVYGGHDHRLRQTLVALTEGSEMPEHNGPEESTLIVITGHVSLLTDGDEWVGHEGDLIVVPRAPHTVTAHEDSAVLLTVAMDIGADER